MSERPPISPRSPRAALEPEQVPPPPKRSDRARNPFVIVGNAIITILLVLMIGIGGAYVYGKQLIEAAGPLKEDKIVNIPARAGKRDIADVLQREGVIDVNPWAFIGSVFALKASSELKPGEYSFQKNASLRDVIGTIVEGKVVQHAVTIPEGLTSEQILSRLTDNDIFAGTVREIPREGTLLPETYKFPRGTTREQVIQRMQQTQKRVLAEIWERRNPDIPVKSPEQLVTLASIIEKETGKADERSRVAAVFVNRLRQKMKLQSDPTIIYGLVGGKGTLGRPIKRSEIQQPSPYNTYVVDGLPPGPIANPGRASLEAAANPARTRDLFFVADGYRRPQPLPKPTTSIRRTSSSCARWKSRSRTTPSNRRPKKPSPPRPARRPIPIPPPPRPGRPRRSGPRARRLRPRLPLPPLRAGRARCSRRRLRWFSASAGLRRNRIPLWPKTL